MFKKKSFPLVKNYVEFFVENYDDIIVNDKNFKDKVATNDLFFSTLGGYDHDTQEFHHMVVYELYVVLKKHYDKEYKGKKRCDRCGYF